MLDAPTIDQTEFKQGQVNVLAVKWDVPDNTGLTVFADGKALTSQYTNTAVTFSEGVAYCVLQPGWVNGDGPHQLSFAAQLISTVHAVTLLPDVEESDDQPGGL